MWVHAPIFEGVRTPAGNFADNCCALQRLKIISKGFSGGECSRACEDVDGFLAAKHAAQAPKLGKTGAYRYHLADHRYRSSSSPVAVDSHSLDWRYPNHRHFDEDR